MQSVRRSSRRSVGCNDWGKVDQVIAAESLLAQERGLQ